MKRQKPNIKKKIKKRIDFKLKSKNNHIAKTETILIQKKNIITNNKKINVVISAYDCPEYIEECLDSINNQTYKANKILLGIDGCQETLKKVLSIRNKYPTLELYYSKDNGGPYLMFNALIQLIPDDEYIQIFGADDIMNPNMLEKMSTYDTPTVSKHHGVLFIKKQTMNIYGGFRGWRCAGDSDLISRIKLFTKTNVNYTSKHYVCREHDKQLTKRIDTNFNSDLRKEYIKIYHDNEKLVNPVIKVEPICSIIEKI